VTTQATEEDGSDEDELDDEAMMSLDAGMATLFSEQKKKMEAKREEKVKVHKERTLILDFKMKVRRLSPAARREGPSFPQKDIIFNDAISPPATRLSRHREKLK